MQSGQEVVELHLDDIIPNRFQPREVFDERALKELAASIKEHGVIQPIIVRQVNNKYEIIAGERRYKASALAGMTKIPAIIKNLDDKEAAKVALLENLQRKNLNPIEEARTYQKILELDQMTQESLAKTMGKSQSAVANKLRLLALPDDIQHALLKEEISERHARTLLNLNNVEDQRKMLKRVITEKMSVRNLEEEIKKLNNSNNTKEEGGQQNMQNDYLLNNQIPNAPLIIDNKNQPVPNNSNPINTKPTLMDMANLGNKENEIVNYGDIDDDELDNENYKEDEFQEPASTKPIDIAQMKSDSVDIGQILNNQMQQNPDEKNKISNDLDSLLNIKPPTTTNNNGFNPALEAIRNSEDNSNNINKQDYFQAPELMSIQLPNATNNSSAIIKNLDNPLNNSVQQQNNNQNNMINNNLSFFQNTKEPEQEKPKQEKSLGMALMEETYNITPKEKEKEYSIQQMVQKIRETIQLLERTGAKIDTDEIDFENQYQIVIRIDKNN